MKQILATPGGTLCVPKHPMIDRKDGANLWTMPPRDVWDRSELTAEELTQWSFLIAASGRAMLDVLPQLRDGVINYWEAGNWSLNDLSEPKGVKKTGPEHKHVHMHLIGRSRNSTDPDWAWGEAPCYPPYKNHQSWWANKENLTRYEQRVVGNKARELLIEKYNLSASDAQVEL